MIYQSKFVYITISDSDEIKALERIKALMYANAETIVGSSHLEEYDFDDTQIKVKTKYRSMSDLMSDIDAIDKKIQRLRNSLSRVSITRSYRNFI